ncbi:MAG TPA: IS4 family transposase [Hyphomonadaceae bacterium]|nr:IS4 family transposase [Hyphomonadaceae bacterium]
MSTHAQSPNEPTPSGFLAAWTRLLGPRGVPTLDTRRGRKPRVPLSQVLSALTFHVMQDTGTLAEHLFQLFRTPLTDSAWSDRRVRLPWDIFAELMRRALRPRATRRQHRAAFWRGWRLVGLDGTQFSLINTPQVAATVAKARTRRGRAGFAKITTAVLLEIGLHNPLAAGIGRRGESEWALAQRLLAQIPKGALLLADRLYGVTAFARAAQTTCQRVGSHFLLRASRAVKPRLLRRLRDGTRLVVLSGAIEVREIRVRVGRRGHRTHELRLWTSLLDPRTAPARELAQVYASRWEHEGYFREIKRQLRRSALLQSHTVETGAQEIAAIVLASAVIAEERARAATAQIPALRISFGQILHVVRGMWLFFGPFDDVFTDPQKTRVIRRGRALIRRHLIAPRRPRTCPRAVRQPVTKWPRLLKPQSIQAPWVLQLV